MPQSKQRRRRVRHRRRERVLRKVVGTRRSPESVGHPMQESELRQPWITAQSLVNTIGHPFVSVVCKTCHHSRSLPTWQECHPSFDDILRGSSISPTRNWAFTTFETISAIAGKSCDSNHFVTTRALVDSRQCLSSNGSNGQGQALLGFHAWGLHAPGIVLPLTHMWDRLGVQKVSSSSSSCLGAQNLNHTLELF